MQAYACEHPHGQVQPGRRQVRRGRSGGAAVPHQRYVASHRGGHRGDGAGLPDRVSIQQSQGAADGSAAAG